MSEKRVISTEASQTYPMGQENGWISDDLRAAYIHDTKKHPLLEKEEIENLSRRVQAGLHAAAQLENTEATLTAKQMSSLELIKKDGHEARNGIVLANTGLVFRWAAHHEGRGVEYLDLVQAGNIGLMRAAEKFDPDKGFAFSTYATRWIRSLISEAIHESGRSIRVPRDHSMQLQKMRRIDLEYQTATGKVMPIEEVAKAMHKTEEEISDLISMEHGMVSLSDRMWIDDDGELEDYVIDQRALTTEDQVVSLVDGEPQDRSPKNLFTLLGLSVEEEQVLRVQFGFEYGGEVSVREVARTLKRADSTVKNISKSALDRLRLEANWPELIGTLDLYDGSIN